MSRRSSFLVVVAIALSTPMALGVESVVRKLLLPPAVEELRTWLRPQLEPVAWLLAASGLLATVVALALQPRIFRSLLRRSPEGATPTRVTMAYLGTLALATSIPQVPALLATVAFTFGAPLVPTSITVAIGTAGVLVQWLRLTRLSAAPAQVSAAAGSPSG